MQTPTTKEPNPGEKLLAFGVILVVLAITLGMLSKVMGGLMANELTNVTVTNQTINFTAYDTNYPLSAVNETHFLDVWNDSVTLANTTLAIANSDKGGNWTVSGSNIMIHAGGVINDSSDGNDTGLFNVSYVSRVGSAARDEYEKGLGGVIEMANWMDDITVIFIAVIIIGLLMVIVGITQMKQGGTSEMQL